MGRRYRAQKNRPVGFDSEDQRPKKEGSKLERLWLSTWEEACLRIRGLSSIQLVREFRFHPVRKFRLDFALPYLLIGIELDGFVMRHKSNWGISQGHEKINLAIELGWVVVRHTSRTLGSREKRDEAIHQLMRIIEIRERQIIQTMPLGFLRAILSSKQTG